MSLRVVAISDTHCMHDDIQVPDGDVLIHAGDMTMDGSPADIFEVFAWLSRQPHERIVVTPGNHDFGFQQIPQLVGVLKAKFPRVEVLIDQETWIAGLRVYGSPWQPWFHEWAYNFRPGPAGEREAETTWSRIPDDTAVLITHGPVNGILDTTLRGRHVGCAALRARVSTLPALRLHVSGHIHESYGSQAVGDVLYVNACSCDSQYQPSQPPIVVDVDAHRAVVAT